jgi:hypothetical protein
MTISLDNDLDYRFHVDYLPEMTVELKAKLRNDPTEPPKLRLNGRNQPLNGAPGVITQASARGTRPIEEAIES